MDFLAELHGTVAAVLLCTLLLIDEAGIPLPFAPNELLLLFVGILIAGGAFPPWVILPLVALAMTVGMVAGYGWARVIGQSGLRSLAERFGAHKAYDRVQARVQSSGPVGIGVCRMIPGLRPYATLISGAAGVPFKAFMLGAVPALVVWELIVVLLGVVVGLPAMYLLGRFEKLALRGGLLIGLGLLMWLAIRRIPDDWQCGIDVRLRTPLAVLVDVGILGSIIAGAFALGRLAIHVTSDGWIEVAVIFGGLLCTALFARGDGLTPGERLFRLRYWGARPEAAR